MTAWAWLLLTVLGLALLGSIITVELLNRRRPPVDLIGPNRVVDVTGLDIHPVDEVGDDEWADAVERTFGASS